MRERAGRTNEEEKVGQEEVNKDGPKDPTFRSE